MADITLGGNPVHTVGTLPQVGSAAPPFTLTNGDMADFSLDFAGKQVVLNIFPSIGTGVCQTAARRFNKLAADLENTVVINVSEDLPFAQAAFCGAEGLDDVTVGSAFRSDFGRDYGVLLTDGKFKGLLARAVVVIGTDGTVKYTELVPEIAQEPDYDAAIAALS